MLRPCRQVPCLPRKVCDKVVCERWRVKDGVWQSCVCVWQSCVWKMVCDKDGVWQRGVWQSCVCVWKIVCDKEMCDKVVCERWCVTKRYVTNFVLKDGVWQCCVEEAAAAEAAAEAEERDTESKTRTPHKDVGNKEDCWTAKNLSVPGLDWPPETQQYRPLEPRFGHSFLQFWSSAATHSPWTGFQNPLQFRWRLSWFRSACQIPPGWRYLSPKCSHSPLRNQAQIFTPFIPRGCLAFLTCTEWIWNSWAESVLFLVLHGLAAALRSERKVRLLIKTLHRNTDDWNAEDAQISSSPEPHQGPDPQAPSRSNKI